jgi:hypothetical protein
MEKQLHTLNRNLIFIGKKVSILGVKKIIFLSVRNVIRCMDEIENKQSNFLMLNN